MATSATTCDVMRNISNLHGAIGLARSRRHASSFSTATTCSTDDFPALTKEDLPARDSLEFARKTIAQKLERRNAALSARLPAVDAADVIDVDDDTFGSPLVRMGRREANRPWDHYIPHKDSLDLSQERATHDVVTKRRILKQRVCTRLQTVLIHAGAALARAKSGCSLDGSTSEQCTSVEGRPKIEVLQHTVRKLA